MVDARAVAGPGDRERVASGEHAAPDSRSDGAEQAERAAPDSRTGGAERAVRSVVRRWLRRGAFVLGAYALAVVLSQLAIIAAVSVGRAVGDDPRSDFYGVANFRVVDDRVWAGGQPIPQAYADLYDAGVRLVVDLRTGAPDDRNEVDLAHLEELGMGYLRLSVPDGNVPSDEQVELFVEAVERTDGIVLVHCGAGVGRSSSMTSAYLRATGRDPHVVDHLALGQHTVEQLWFISTGDTNVVVHGASELLDAPRRAWSRIRAAI